MTTTASDEWPDFQEELAAIREDPKVKSLARRRAGDPDLAEDALQEAYYAVARVADPVAIRNLRAYFCQVLIREISHLRGQLGATPVDDFARVVEARQGRSGGNSPAPPPVAETVSRHLLTQDLLRAFTARRRELATKVPGRSPDPRRYRDAIVAVAERVLGITIFEVIRDADWNAALRAVYPEWFAAPGCAVDARDQRFSRARADVRALLMTIVRRGDLYS